MKKVLLLGASGFIGSKCLDVIDQEGDEFVLSGFSVGNNIEKINEIIAKNPMVSSVCSLEEVHLDGKNAIKTYHGEEGILKLIEDSDADLVVNAIGGFAGFLPSLTALRLGKTLCLANKESLVVGGDLLKKTALETGARIIPIDSEHVALSKLLSKVDRKNVSKMIITASGGPFRDRSRSSLSGVTPDEALAHPNWKMGKRISIDSATMFNKGFELIEAHHLFDWPFEDIEVLINDESYVHSMLLMKDGTYLADISKPDMIDAVRYALHEGEIDFEPDKGKSLDDFKPYHFRRFDKDRYPAVDICLNAYKRGPLGATILNAADEEAVQLFLDGMISFLDIDTLVSSAINYFDCLPTASEENILSADRETRTYIKRGGYSK